MMERTKMIKMSDIKISDAYAATTPKEEKMEECRRYWDKHHLQDRYIVVNNNGILIDGYIQYLVLKENGIENVEVKVSGRTYKKWRRKRAESYPCYRSQMTTYIYGIHPNSTNRKERVWRVPSRWIGWENDLLPGDTILVHTNRGVQPITITKIEWSSKCPTNMKVKKVCKKFM